MRKIFFKHYLKLSLITSSILLSACQMIQTPNLEDNYSKRVGVNTLEVADLQKSEEYLKKYNLNYCPIEPLAVTHYTAFNAAKQDWEAILFPNLVNKEANTHNEMIALLPLFSSSVQLEKIQTSGASTPILGKFAKDPGYYKVTMDYMQNRNELFFPSSKLNQSISLKSNEPLFYGKVGVGLRVVAYVETRVGNVNLASIHALNTEAKAKRLKGSFNVHVIGLNSSEITKLTPLTSEINSNTGNILNAALNAIKNRIMDVNTKITPHWLAVGTKDGCILKEDLRTQLTQSTQPIQSSESKSTKIQTEASVEKILTDSKALNPKIELKDAKEIKPVQISIPQNQQAI